MKRETQAAREDRDMAPEVASATECTGLMPALPADDAAEEARAALYAVHSGKGAREKLYRK